MTMLYISCVDVKIFNNRVFARYLRRFIDIRSLEKLFARVETYTVSVSGIKREF